MTPTSPEALERRLALVEAKLDLVIRKLDAALRSSDVRRPDSGAPDTNTLNK